MTRRFHRPAILGLALVVAGGRIAQPSSSVQSSAVASIAFEQVNKHIVVQVSVNNSRPLPFVLDTGAEAAVIRASRANELGLALRGEIGATGGGPGSVSGSRVEGATLRLAGVQGFSQPVRLALPLTNMSPALGQDIDGIIGGEFIRQFVLELDYQARRITLHDKERFRYTGTGEELPLEFNADRHPVVKAEVTPVDGQPIAGSFLLDIGSGAALALHSPFVERHGLLPPSQKTIRAIGMAGVGGQMAGRIGRIATIRLGRFRIDAPLTLFSQDQAGALANASLAGNIGGQIASRFRMFLDYGRKRIILEPSSTFADPFDRAFSGISIRAEPPAYRTFRIREVLENSPASEVGLLAGDVIAAIDGKPATALTLGAIHQMLERAASYELTIHRSDQVLKVTLTPRRLV